jgi:hypothetical protein
MHTPNLCRRDLDRIHSAPADGRQQAVNRTLPDGCQPVRLAISRGRNLPKAHRRARRFPASFLQGISDAFEKGGALNVLNLGRRP